MDPMLIVIFWVACALIAAVIGSSKSGALGAIFGLFVGLLLGPLGILWALLSPGHRRKCGECRNWINRDARKCLHCGARA